MSRYSPEFLSEMKREPMTVNFIQQAIKDRGILEALVTSCDKDNTLKLNLGKGIEGRITFDELEYKPDGSESKVVAAVSKVGKRIKFIPKSIEKEGSTYIVQCSRKESQKECYANFISKLIVGDIVPARVVRIEGYGIFCDIGCGIIALLPTNCISVTHIVCPKRTLAGLKRLNVIIKDIDENYKIQLSHKELLGTWEEEASQFREDDIVTGTVLSIESYGVFIRLSQNLSGLAEPVAFDLTPGDRVTVKINNILKSNMKVKLYIIDRLSGESEHLKFKYRVTAGHIDEWVYSTEKAKRLIETKFGEN